MDSSTATARYKNPRFR